MSTSCEMRPLQRSQSLPHVNSRQDSGVGYSGSCSDIDQAGLYQTHHSNHRHSHSRHQHPLNGLKIPYEARLVAELKQLMTLRQHYYPEGGWGWVVIAIGLLVQCLAHGIHTSSGIVIIEISKYYERPHIQSGDSGYPLSP